MGAKHLGCMKNSCTGEKRRRDGEPECLRCLEVEHKLKFYRLLHWNTTDYGAPNFFAAREAALGSSLPSANPARTSAMASANPQLKVSPNTSQPASTHAVPKAAISRSESGYQSPK